MPNRPRFDYPVAASSVAGRRGVMVVATGPIVPSTSRRIQGRGADDELFFVLEDE